MIFTQLFALFAVLIASASAHDLKSKGSRCHPKVCRGIDCLATLARIAFEPKWCGGELLERLAKRIVMRPDVDWSYTIGVSAGSSDPCSYLFGQDPSTYVALTNSLSAFQCCQGAGNFVLNFCGGTAVISTTTPQPIDYSYTTHASWSTNQVKYANDGSVTYVGVPLYFRDGLVRVVTIGKPNSALPVVCCDEPDARFTQCRAFC